MILTALWAMQLSTAMDRIAGGQAPSDDALQRWIATQKGQMNDDVDVQVGAVLCAHLTPHACTHQT